MKKLFQRFKQLALWKRIIIGATVFFTIAAIFISIVIIWFFFKVSIAISDPLGYRFPKSTVVEQQANSDLKELFDYWEIMGKMDPIIMSSFYSVIKTRGKGYPNLIMRDWIDEITSNNSEYQSSSYDHFNYLRPLSVEDSFFNLWKLAFKEEEPENLAIIRLALISYYGEKLQHELIEKWIGQIQENSTSNPVNSFDVQNLKTPIHTNKREGEISSNPINKKQTNMGKDYLKELFSMWLISGKIDTWVLSPFHSLIEIRGKGDSRIVLQKWIEYAKIKASKGTGLSVSEFEYLNVDLSNKLTSLSVEDSFFRLWKRAIEEQNLTSIASVRLALISYVGEKRQQELIEKWNKLI